MTRQARTISSWIAQLPWLDTIAEPLQRATGTLFGANRATQQAKDLLNGTPLRHRIHPALIAVPIGAWTTGLLLDLLEARAERPQEWARSADTAIALGVVGALPSVATGLADWTDTYDHQRRVGIAHALSNSVALALYATSLGLRFAGRRGAARVCGALGFGAVSIGGMLGGELVYTLGVNVPHTIYPKPPTDFVAVLASDDLPQGKPVVAEAGRVPILLVRDGDTIHAVQNWCTHAGGPLNEGKVADGVAECPWHGSRFCLSDGRPLQGPASMPLRTFDVHEAEGHIFVRPNDEARSWPPSPADPGPVYQPAARGTTAPTND